MELRKKLIDVALHRERYKLYRLLLKNDDPNLANSDGSTALHLFSGSDVDHDMMDIFFKIHEGRQPVQVDARDKKGRTPLHLALGHGHKNCVRVLLRNGADPNLVNEQGATPLHVICEKDDDRLAKAFFDNCNVGRDHRPLQVDVRDDSGRTPLHAALFRGRAKLIGLLLRAGADPNLANSEGCALLHVICRGKYDDDDLAELFLKSVEEVRGTLQSTLDARDRFGDTPLHLAMDRGHRNLAELLLKRGADPSLSNDQELTALHLCIRKDDDELVRKFFEICDEKRLRVRVDARDNWDQTPLQWAVANLNPRVVDALLDHGADASSFRSPPQSYVAERFDRISNRSGNAKLRLTSGALAVRHSFLTKVGHAKSSLRVTQTYVNLFREWGVFKKPSNFDERWFDHEDFARLAQRTTVIPGLTLDHLIRMKPDEAAERLGYEDYYEFACSEKLLQFRPTWPTEACVDHLCERLTRGLFRRWSMDYLLELTGYRLPILCCDMIIDRLSDRDLWGICLAPVV